MTQHILCILGLALVGNDAVIHGNRFVIYTTSVVFVVVFGGHLDGF